MTRSTRRTLWILALAALVVAGLSGVLWLDGRRVERIEVSGLGHATRADVVRLTRVEAGQRLYDLSTTLVEDRVRRHPWIARVEATRYPTGTLALAVTERAPVALAVGAEGQPLALLDASGMAMPVVPVALALDLPLVREARLPVNRARPVESRALRAFLAALPGLSPAADALVSEVRLTREGELVLTTAPTTTGTALDVRLGREDIAARLDRLVAFWQQAVVTRPETRYAVVDVRFAGQVVTREAAGDAAFPDSTLPAGALVPVGIDSAAARRSLVSDTTAVRPATPAAASRVPSDRSDSRHT